MATITAIFDSVTSAHRAIDDAPGRGIGHPSVEVLPVEDLRAAGVGNGVGSGRRAEKQRTSAREKEELAGFLLHDHAIDSAEQG